MEVRGRKRSFRITDKMVTDKYVSIRVDDSKELAFWLDICLTEKDLHDLLDKIQKAKSSANISPIS